MLEVKYKNGKTSTTFIKSDTNISLVDVWSVLQNKGLLKKDFYIMCNGRIVQENENILSGLAILVPRVFGGKGGFGSMLRAIGAQIEKTTNREACRDLSGRRLRDINEEKRLKAWIEKQASREDEAIERKKKKLERLCAEPKHVFKDKNYEHERSVLTEKIDDAVEEGFKNAAAENINIKPSINSAKKIVKRKTILDDIDSDLSSSSDSDESEVMMSNKKKLKTDDNDKSSADDSSSSSLDQKEKKESEEGISNCDDVNEKKGTSKENVADHPNDKSIVL